jgi:hypothetical protein
MGRRFPHISLTQPSPDRRRRLWIRRPLPLDLVMIRLRIPIFKIAKSHIFLCACTSAEVLEPLEMARAIFIARTFYRPRIALRPPNGGSREASKFAVRCGTDGATQNNHREWACDLGSSLLQNCRYYISCNQFYCDCFLWAIRYCIDILLPKVDISLTTWLLIDTMKEQKILSKCSPSLLNLWSRYLLRSNATFCRLCISAPKCSAHH